MKASAGRIRRNLIVNLGDQIVLASSISKPKYTIGRLPDNDLVLPDSRVSQHHTEIDIDARGTVIMDLGSEQGTVLDGIRLLPLQPHVLKEAAIIEIGPYVIRYRTQAEGIRDQTTRQAQIAQREPEVLDPANALLSASGYLRYLPAIFQANEFMGRFLRIFETIWEPLDQRQDQIQMYLDPRTCPAAMLPWLAGWLGLSLNEQWPEQRSRDFLADAVNIYRWRGTKYGIARVIEVCTGLSAEISDSPTEPFVFRIKVRPPQNEVVDIELLEQLIMTHKPAHAGYVLEVAP